MDDFDIYSDLPDFGWLKQEYEADVDITKEALPTSEKDITELKTKLLKLEKVHKLVLSHYSSLWKTAKQERKRMERQIAELRSQLDNFAFKRNHRQKNNNAVPPLPVLPVNATVIQVPNNFQFNYPPPLMSQAFLDQQVNTNLYCYPPPPIQKSLCTNQDWKPQEETSNEHLADNVVVPPNIITPENSHSSDESDDDIVKKSHYRSTVYGERLRKKLLEEKRNEARQKKESLNENKVNDNKIDRKTKELENIHKNEKVNSLKDKVATSVSKESHITTVIEENVNQNPSEIDTQNAKAPNKQQQLRNESEIEVKDNNKNNEPNIVINNDIERKKNEKDCTVRKDDVSMKRIDEYFKVQRERDLNKRKKDEQLRIGREREVERKKEDESRIRRERDYERRRKEEEIEKTKREEQFEKRRREEEVEKRRKEEEVEKRRKEEEVEKRRKEEEVEKRRKDQEIERRKKEAIDKKRREEINRRRKDEEMERRKREENDRRRKEDAEKRRADEEMERRKREENDKRRKEDIDKRRKDEEIERRKREEVDKKRKDENEKRKKEDMDKKRKEEETARRKRDEVDKRRREEEAERRKKEEEQHMKKLKEIEKNRNEKQLEELIKERARIEKEMNSMENEDTEEGEITESFNDTSCKELSAGEKPQEHKEELKENSRDKSKQSQENQSDNRRNNDGKDGGRSTRSNSSRAATQTINDNLRKGHHEYSKSDRHQDHHFNYDKHKHSDLRSRRDQLGRDRERRKSSHYNKSRNRLRSNSGHRSDEDRDYSPKRIKLQGKNRDLRDNLKDTESNRNRKIIGKSPKRKRQIKSDERSPQNSKKRKLSSEKYLDCNIKSNKNIVQKTNTQVTNKVGDASIEGNKPISNICTNNIIDSALSKESTSKHAVANTLATTENVRNISDNMKEEKEKLTEKLIKDQDQILNKIPHPQKECKENDSIEDQVKHTNPLAVKRCIDHTNKKETLINELFEVQERPVATSANLKQVKNLKEASDETILSELEDGEITDSDESTLTEELPKEVPSQSTDKPTDTMIFLEKNKLDIENNKNKSTSSLQKNNEEIAIKCNSERTDSILYNALTENKNDVNVNIENTKMEFHEKTSNTNKSIVPKTSDKSETCNEIANKIDNTSQIINQNQVSENISSHIECKINKSRETIESTDGKENALPEVNDNKIVSEPTDKINTVTEKEKQNSGKITNHSMKIVNTELESSTQCSSILTTSNILLEQSRQNCLKINNLENKMDNKGTIKRTELHSETNSVNNTCLKENIEVRNNSIKKDIGHVNNERVDEKSSKPVVKLENPSQDNAAEKTVHTSQTNISTTAVKKIIVVRRRRRPVQLSDSPPVVVINNAR